MMRTGASRVLLQSLNCSSKTVAAPGLRFSHVSAFKNSSFVKRSDSFALAAYRPAVTSLIRSYATATPQAPGTTRMVEREAELRTQKLSANPGMVSLESSMHPINSEVGAKAEQEEEADVDMMAGVRHDIKVISDTFALKEVPREAYRIGLAGVIPYLATATATVVCSVEVANASENGGMGLFLSGHTAELGLHILEPLQVGYGAAILSFLGAIHWGLEWAGYGGTQGYKRYAIGVFTPAVAWATVMLPVEYALITQFLAFNTLYTVDSIATNRGWTPPWYSSYRFVLTAVVGTAIVVSLIGRGQVMDRINKLPTAGDRFKQIQAEAKAHGEDFSNA